MNKNRTSKTTHSMDKIMRINCFKPLNSDVICYKAKISTNHFNKNPNNYYLPQAVSFLKIGTISNLSLLSFSLLRASLCLWYLPVLLSSWLGLTHCSLKLGIYVLPLLENIPLLSQVTPSLPFYFPHNFCRFIMQIYWFSLQPCLICYLTHQLHL